MGERVGMRWNRIISALHTRGYYARVLLAVAIGIALSVVAFSLLLNFERHEITDAFNRTAGDRALALAHSVADNVETLEDIESLYKASTEVQRHEFRAFIEHELEKRPGIQALEWIPRVLASERATYEEAARNDGFPEFRFVERETQGTMVRADLREEYFPVYYVEPYKGNEAALGFDLASNPIRLEALNKSRDTGQGVATARITLVQETEDQFGFLVFKPIYRKGFLVETLAQRRENLMGFALGVFRITDMLEHALALSDAHTGGPGLNIQLYDRSAPPEQQLLFTTVPVNGAEGQPSSGLSFTETFDVADRTWELIVTSPVAGLSVWSIWQAWAALASGLLFTGLLSAYFLAAARRAVAVERLVGVRTLELSQSNQRLEKAEEVLRDELERASRIQLELLPSQSPTIPHFGLAARCIPARHVAGDFFDWHQRDVSTLDFVLCDVMGKGMPAALLMATVRSALRASAQSPSPVQVLRQVEQAIGNDLRRAESFVTLFYGRLEIEERRLTYVDVGHGLGFVRRADGSTEPLEGRNLPLGVFPDSELQESAVTLQEGDMLVLYTDGLVEAQDGTMADVRDLIKNDKGFRDAETVVNSLIEATDPHRSGEDDATVLVLICSSIG